MYVRSMSNWIEWVQWTRGRSLSVPLRQKCPATNNSYTFVNQHAANTLLVFGYETKHEAIAEGQAIISRSIREFIQILCLAVSLKSAVKVNKSLFIHVVVNDNISISISGDVL